MYAEQSRRLLLSAEGAAETIRDGDTVYIPGVTYTRSNVHFVATEYGAVCLRGLTVAERARKLISIAHPSFRDQLKEDFERIYRTKLS